MDIATIIGVVLSFVLILAAIFLGGSMVLFIDVPSMLIVIGGTIGSTLVKNPLATVLGTAKVVGKAFQVKVPEADELITLMLDCSKKARKEGMLVLESVKPDYEFLGKGIGLCVDGVEQEEIREILEADIRFTAARHKSGAKILEGMGASAPAFGMIGTLIGLVQMLANMEDPSSIGPAMAVALLTTMYGAVLANVLFLPLADKLKLRSQEELLAMTLCLEGVMGLARGDNPNAINMKLRSFLAPTLREPEQKKEGEAA